MEQQTPNLGRTPTADARRDAVHVAVAPVVAAHRLLPGDRVGLGATSGLASDAADNVIGVVDPFRTEPVAEGERFWLFLFPGTVTSLRHVWQHPAFTPKVPL